MGKQRLLLALASAREQELLSGAFRGLEEIEVLPPAGDGDEVLRLLAQGCVDILVLEIMFRGAHGEPVLEAIQRLPEQRRPLLFLITPYSEDRLLAPWADDVVRCFVKPYLPELLVLRVLQEATQSERPRGLSIAFGSAAILERRITGELLEIGIPAHHRGYYMLRDAIRLYAEADHPAAIRITLDIYPRIAEAYGCHSRVVEHAIRGSIEYAWAHGNLNAIHARFGYTVNAQRGKPGNAEFIACMAEHVRLKPTQSFLRLT